MSGFVFIIKILIPKKIEINTVDDREILLNLDDFLLDYKELKKIDGLITGLNRQFQETTAANNV